MKRISFIVVILVIAVVAAWNVSFGIKNTGLSALSLVNIEMLALGEPTNGEPEGNNEYLAWGAPQKCNGYFCPNGGTYTACEENGRGNSCTEKGKQTCTCGTNCNPCN
jgi:hypothetical protein